MKWVRKFLHIFIGLISPLLLFLFKTDKFIAWLNTFADASSIQSLALWVIIVCMIANFFASTFSPLKILEKREEKNKLILRHAANALVTKYRVAGYQIKFNVMVRRKQKFPFPFRTEPTQDNAKGKIVWRPSLFKVIWTEPPDHIIKNFRIAIHQGTSGQALENNKIVGYDVSLLVKSNILGQTLKLNKKQERRTSGLTLLASVPIEGFDKAGLSAIVGVLTVESNTPDAGKLLLDDTSSGGLKSAREIFYADLQRLTIPFSYLL